MQTAKEKSHVPHKLITHLVKRQLKVYGKYFSRSDSKAVIFPEIRLCGKWLRDLGFERGQAVTVQHEENKIIITVDNEPPVMANEAQAPRDGVKQSPAMKCA